MSPRDKRYAEFYDRLMLVLFVVIVLANSAGLFGD